MKSNGLNDIVEELRTNSDDTSREMSLCQERTLHTIRKENAEIFLKASWKNLKQPEVPWMKLK